MHIDTYIHIPACCASPLLHAAVHPRAVQYAWHVPRDGEGIREAGAASAVAVYCQAQRSQCSLPGTGRKVTTIY